MDTTSALRQKANASPTMREVMTRSPFTIGTDQTLERAHEVMREHGLRHLPVLRGGKLVGVLSQRDLYFLEAIAGVDSTVDRIEDAMTSDVYTVGPNDALQDVASAMAEHRYGCAVVVEAGHILGIFTSTDALEMLGGRRGHS